MRMKLCAHLSVIVVTLAVDIYDFSLNRILRIMSTVIEITLNKRKSYTILRSEEVNAIIHGKFLFSFCRYSWRICVFSSLQINLNSSVSSLQPLVTASFLTERQNSPIYTSAKN